MFADSKESAPDANQTDEMKDYLQRSMKIEKIMARLEQIAEGKIIDPIDGEDKNESNS